MIDIVSQSSEEAGAPTIIIMGDIDSRIVGGARADTRANSRTRTNTPDI